MQMTNLQNFQKNNCYDYKLFNTVKTECSYSDGKFR